MTKKQYRRRLEYEKGYRRGYYREIPMSGIERSGKSDTFIRGFHDGRSDLKAGEYPEIRKS